MTTEQSRLKNSVVSESILYGESRGWAGPRGLGGLPSPVAEKDSLGEEDVAVDGDSLEGNNEKKMFQGRQSFYRNSTAMKKISDFGSGKD